MDKRPNGAKAYVVYENKILWVLRDNNPTIPNPDTWNLPGGTREESDESDEACLRRELAEEINLKPSHVMYLGKFINLEGDYVARYLIRITPEEYDNLKL